VNGPAAAEPAGGRHGPSQASRVRVARVIARMNVGGPAQQIARLLHGLDPARYEQRLFCGHVEEGEADFLELRAQDLSIHRIESMRRSLGPAQDVASLLSLVAAFRRFRPHVVHTHTAKAGVLGRLAARLVGVPVVVHTFHGHLLGSYWGSTKTQAVVAMEAALARHTDHIVSVGTKVRDDLLRAGIGRPEQYTVVPPGVELSDSAPSQSEARDQLGLPRDIPIMGFVGRLAAVKRPDRLLEVIRLVRASIPEVRLVIAGEGPEYAATRQRASDLGDCVSFLGWRSDVQVVYAASDLVLLTSDNEGMPVSLIEAAMCGVPGVTTAVGSAAEVVLDGVTGCVVQPGSAALAKAAVQLLSDPAGRQRMGEAAQAHAQRFAAARLVRDTDAIYQTLLIDRGLLRVEDKP
jgi:glycosyltransferase involved in cell wall biosynthesis